MGEPLDFWSLLPKPELDLCALIRWPSMENWNLPNGTDYLTARTSRPVGKLNPPRRR